MKIKVKKGSKEWFRRKIETLGSPPAPDPLSIFAGDMWNFYDLGDPSKRYEKFLAQGKPPFTRLFDSLLLYDKVVVPTHDFLSITVLVGVLGENSVIEMLEQGVLKFVRVRGALAYVGNGGGLKTYSIHENDETPIPPFSDDEPALEWALSGLNPRPRENNLRRLVLENTRNFPMADLNDLIRHETYTDILKSPYLKGVFSVRNTHLDRLVGIEGNQVRCGESEELGEKGGEIDTVMRISRANTELHLAILSGCLDSVTGTPIGHLLKAKRERLACGTASFESLTTLKELTSIPEIAAHVLDVPVEQRPERLHDILVKRNTRDASAFRTWFHGKCRDNPGEVAKEYINLLNDAPFVSTQAGRAIRLFLTTGAGLLSGAGGLAASLVDSFLADLLRKRNPKFFIEDLRQIGR